jgi:hypothetical protein
MGSTLLESNLKHEIGLMYKHIEKKRPSIDKIIETMKQNFIIKDIEYDKFNYKFSNGTAMLNHYFIKFAFMKSWKEILLQNKVEEIFKTIEIKLNNYAELFCGIKLSIPFVLINSIKR